MGLGVGSGVLVGASVAAAVGVGEASGVAEAGIGVVGVQAAKITESARRVVSSLFTGNP